jgi:hypothetical protein
MWKSYICVNPRRLAAIMNVSPQYLKRLFSDSGYQALPAGLSPAEILRRIFQLDVLNMWTVRVSKYLSSRNDVGGLIAALEDRGDQHTSRRLRTREGQSIIEDEWNASMHEILVSLTKMQSEFGHVKKLLLSNTHVVDHPLLTELKRIITDAIDRFSRFLEVWPEEVSHPVAIEKSTRSWRLRGKPKEKKQAH